MQMLVYTFLAWTLLNLQDTVAMTRRRYGKKDGRDDDFYDGGKKEGKKSKDEKNEKSVLVTTTTQEAPEICSVMIDHRCMGDCNHNRRTLLRKSRGDDNGDEPFKVELSLVYQVPYIRNHKSNSDTRGGGRKKHTFCLVADPTDGLCQMLSPTALIVVNDHVVVRNVIVSDHDNVIQFQAWEGATIEMNVTIPLNPAILCIREGSYTYYLAK